MKMPAPRSWAILVSRCSISFEGDRLATVRVKFGSSLRVRSNLPDTGVALKKKSDIGGVSAVMIGPSVPPNR